MFFRRGRRLATIDYLLATLSPRAVAEAATRFLAERTPATMLDEIRRSATRMTPDERVAFARVLGFASSAGDGFPIGDNGLSARALLAHVDANEQHAVSEFPAFLEHNPRAIRSLDPESIRAVLLPVIQARRLEPASNSGADAPYSDELARTLQNSLPRISWTHARSTVARSTPAVVTAAGVLAVAVIAIVLSSAIRKLDEPSQVVATRVATPALAPVRAPFHARAVRSAPVAKPHLRPERHAIVRRSQPRMRALAFVPDAPVIGSSHRESRSRWKFDPARNHFFGEQKIAQLKTAQLPKRASIPSAVAQNAASAKGPPLLARARLVVTSYLAALMRGDASGALENLGLSASAPLGNLSESAIFGRAENFHIVNSVLRDGGSSAKVDVEIASASGRYFGVYTVVEDGTTEHISEHTVIPANSDLAAQH